MGLTSLAMVTKAMSEEGVSDRRRWQILLEARLVGLTSLAMVTKAMSEEQRKQCGGRFLITVL